MSTRNPDLPRPACYVPGMHRTGKSLLRRLLAAVVKSLLVFGTLMLAVSTTVPQAVTVVQHP